MMHFSLDAPESAQALSVQTGTWGDNPALLANGRIVPAGENGAWVVPGEPERLAIRPYPRALEERVQLAGRELLLRPIRPEDGQRLMDFYAKASPHDMRLRFFFARREVPHSELARYSQIDYDREMNFIALSCPDLGDPVTAGNVSAVCDPDNRRAEFALQVAAPWQGMGLAVCCWPSWCATCASAERRR